LVEGTTLPKPAPPRVVIAKNKESTYCSKKLGC
jgi:hypothetical protein